MDDIRVLKAKLLQCETDNQRLREQLHGLITLVKKAWTGDHSAAIDVALIVGVAPPTLEVSSVTDEIVAVPKSQCINNWFRLTVGLINKDYKEKETTRRAQQMLYIRNREAFIDEQMENAKCNNDPKFGEVEQRTNILHNLVESENLKRNELKLKLGMSSSEFQHAKVKHKSRISSAKGTRSVPKISNTGKVDECLVIHSKKTESLQEQQMPAFDGRPLSQEKHKPRAKSAGSLARRKAESKKTTVSKRRPESANVLSTSGKSERVKSGIKSTSKGKIEDKLSETENDIALTVQLLQQRLGIDERGKV